MTRAFLLITAALVCAACSSPTRLYPGGPRHADDVCGLSIDGPTSEGYWVDVDFVDGRPVDDGPFELLPGKHVLEGRAGQRTRHVPGGNFALSFDAVRGQDYRLAAIRLRLKRRIAVELLDAETSQRAAWTETRAIEAP